MMKSWQRGEWVAVCLSVSRERRRNRQKVYMEFFFFHLVLCCRLFRCKMDKELLIKRCVISFTDKFPKCQTREDKMIFYWKRLSLTFMCAARTPQHILALKTQWKDIRSTVGSVERKLTNQKPRRKNANGKWYLTNTNTFSVLVRTFRVQFGNEFGAFFLSSSSIVFTFHIIIIDKIANMRQQKHKE